MATVPVGNKQVGEYAVISTVGSVNDRTNVNNLLGTAVVADPTVVIPAIKNKFIGEYTNIVTVGVSSNGLAVANLAGFAIVQNPAELALYNPPYSFKLKIPDLFSSVVVADNAQVLEIPALKNKQIADYTGIVTYANEQDAATIHHIAAYVIVKEFHPRKELTTFNIEYAEDAQLNLTTTQ